MKKFLIKSILFIMPILLLHLFTLVFYKTDEGDLLRIGYIMSFGNYRKIFKTELDKNIVFTKVSEIDLRAKNKFKVLSIGDSFSEQKGNSYTNYLSEIAGIDVLHVDRYLQENPIQTLYGLLNGHLLDTIKVDWIIVESVERDFGNRANDIDSSDVITANSWRALIEKHEQEIENENTGDRFFTKRIFEFPLYNIYYNLDDNAYNSATYKVKTTENKFSTSNNDLLFYARDLDKININNNADTVRTLNNELTTLSNRCKEKGIKLVVLPSPDKFDLYYDYIRNKSRYPKPLFFNLLDTLPKSYFYVPSKQILSAEIKNKKDIYFYDDTHWSPFGSQIIAGELAKIIKSN